MQCRGMAQGGGWRRCGISVLLQKKRNFPHPFFFAVVVVAVAVAVVLARDGVCI